MTAMLTKRFWRTLTGQERDSETGNDNFKARYYGSSLGRFMTPDPSGIDLADMTDPQQLNLYATIRLP
jgi:RHS repeat-associated protein